MRIARECCWDYMVERPEKGGADSISAAEAALAAGAKLGLGVLVPGLPARLRNGECGRNPHGTGECRRNYIEPIGPGCESRRYGESRIVAQQ